jgi:phosphatidylglycerophosphate synthase
LTRKAGPQSIGAGKYVGMYALKLKVLREIFISLFREVLCLKSEVPWVEARNSGRR